MMLSKTIAKTPAEYLESLSAYDKEPVGYFNEVTLRGLWDRLCELSRVDISYGTYEKDHIFRRIEYGFSILKDYFKDGSERAVFDLYQSDVLANRFDGFLEDFSEYCTHERAIVLRNIKYMQVETRWESMVLGMHYELMDSIEKPGGIENFFGRLKQFNEVLDECVNDPVYLANRFSKSNNKLFKSPDFLAEITGIRDDYLLLSERKPEDVKKTADFLNKLERVKDRLDQLCKHEVMAIPGNMDRVLSGVLAMVTKFHERYSLIDANGKIKSDADRFISSQTLQWRPAHGVEFDEIMKLSFRASVDCHYDGFFEDYRKDVSEMFIEVGKMLSDIQGDYAVTSLLFNKLEEIVYNVSDMKMANHSTIRERIGEFNGLMDVIRRAKDEFFLMPDTLESSAFIIKESGIQSGMFTAENSSPALRADHESNGHEISGLEF